MTDWYANIDPQDLGRARTKLNEQIAEKLAEGAEETEVMGLIERRDIIHAAIPQRPVGFGG